MLVFGNAHRDLTEGLLYTDCRPQDESAWLICFKFSTKLYVVGTQKNRLNETGSFEHPKHMFKLMDKWIITFYIYTVCDLKAFFV